MNIFVFFIFFIRDVKAGFYEKETSPELVRATVLFKKSSVPSALACAQYCYRIDRDTGVDYDGDICKCLKKRTGDKISNTGDGLVSGMFLKQKRLVQLKEVRTEVNVALKKTASLSSTYNDNVASKGNDGNDGTNSVTAWDAGDKWWQVDLLKPTKFDRIDIFLSSYAFGQGRYENVSLVTRNDENNPWFVCKNFGKPTNARLILTKCDSHTTIARYFRFIQHRGSGTNYNMYLNEFSVYATEISYVP